MTPTVTVLVDTYNHERFIEEALASVVEQDFPASETEILVVDDGSTDRTPEIVRKFGPRVRLLRKENGGQASAFNLGIPEARGEIIAFLDGDDWWARNKLARVSEAMAGDPEVGMVGHGIIESDTNSRRLRALAPPPLDSFTLRTETGAQTFRDYMAFLGTSRVSIRSEVLRRVLPVPDQLTIEADEFMSAVAVAQAHALLLPATLTFYRLHEGNLFQFRSSDAGRLRRKQKVLTELAELLYLRLNELGISSAAIATVVDPIRISARRMELSLDGGSRRETYRIEKADLRHSYCRMTPGYFAWKQLSLGLALMLPPRVYYKAREFYSARGLRAIRSWLGEPIPRTRAVETKLYSGNSERRKQANSLQ